MSGAAERRVFSSLESLRGIAALAVVLHHVSWSNAIGDLAFFRNADLMVDFFFVLSGFVIFHAYSSRLSSVASLARFIWVRLGRLYPLHLFMLLVFLGIEIVKLLAEHLLQASGSTPAFSENNLGSLLANLVLLQSWGVCDYHTWNIASWSISVEFFLYMSFALLALIGAPFNRGFGLVGMPAIAVVGMALLSQQPDGPSQSVDILRGVSGFFTGAWVCALKRALPPLHRVAQTSLSTANIAAVLATVAVVVCLGLAGRSAIPVIYPVFAILVLASSCLADGAGINRVLTLRPLLWLGQVSYSIYMVHQAIFWVARQFLRVVMKVPMAPVEGGMQFVVPFWLSNLLLLAVIAAVLISSAWTYRHIEDRYRRRARSIAEDYAAHVLQQRPNRRPAA